MARMVPNLVVQYMHFQTVTSFMWDIASPRKWIYCNTKIVYYLNIVGPLEFELVAPMSEQLKTTTHIVRALRQRLVTYAQNPKSMHIVQQFPK